MFLFITIFVIVYFLLTKTNPHPGGRTIGSTILLLVLTGLVSIGGYAVAAKVIYTNATKAPTEYVFYQKMEPMANVEFASDKDRFYLFVVDGKVIYQTENHKHFYNSNIDEITSDSNCPQWNTIYKRIDKLQSGLLEKYIGAQPKIKYTFKVEPKNILQIEQGEFK